VFHCFRERKSVLRRQRRSESELRAHGVSGIADDAEGPSAHGARPCVAIDRKRQVIVASDLLDHGFGLRPE
jgi:hypothetical protein